MKFAFQPSATERKLLHAAGVPGYLYHEKQLDLLKYIRAIMVKSSTSTRSIKRIKQANYLQASMSLDRPYVLCIGSEPNDMKAKLLAASSHFQKSPADLNSLTCT